GVMVVHYLPADIGFKDALHIAGKSGKTNAIDWSFDLDNQYTVWTGVIGGFFLQLSYFGTDQSQVGRYLTGSSIRDSRLGLLMNGLLKVPMQFCILLIGILVFAYYQFHTPPLFFNNVEVAKIENSRYSDEYTSIMQRHEAIGQEKKEWVETLVSAIKANDSKMIDVSREALQEKNGQDQLLRKEIEALLQKNNPDVEL